MARKRFPEHLWESYVDREGGDVDSQVAHFRRTYTSWKVQIVRLLNVVSPGEVRDVDYYLRKTLSKHAPVGRQAFGNTLAGTFKWICQQNSVNPETTLVTELDAADLEGMDSDESADEEEVSSEYRELIRRA